MKLRRLNQSDGASLYGYEFACPGCEAFLVAKGIPADERLGGAHIIPTTGPHAWGFNDDLGRPTFTPSVLVYEKLHTDGSVYRSFVTAAFSTWATADTQTVELPEVTP